MKKRSVLSLLIILFAVFLTLCIFVYSFKEKDYYGLIGLVIPLLIIILAKKK